LQNVCKLHISYQCNEKAGTTIINYSDVESTDLNSGLAISYADEKCMWIPAVCQTNDIRIP